MCVTGVVICRIMISPGYGSYKCGDWEICVQFRVCVTGVGILKICI